LTFEAVGSEAAMGVRRHRRYSTEFKLQLVEGGAPRLLDSVDRPLLCSSLGWRPLRKTSGAWFPRD